MTSGSRPFSIHATGLLALVLLAGIHGTSLATVSTTTADGTQTAPAAKKKARKTGGKITVMPSSAETRKERENRLKRECRGAVNAGVCEGYTR